MITEYKLASDKEGNYMKSTNQRDFESNYHIISSVDNFRKKPCLMFTQLYIKKC